MTDPSSPSVAPPPRFVFIRQQWTASENMADYLANSVRALEAEYQRDYRAVSMSAVSDEVIVLLEIANG